MPNDLIDTDDASSDTLRRMALWLDSSKTFSHIEKIMHGFHVPGLAVSLVVGHGIHSKAFASASKAPTAVCVAMLVESHPSLDQLGWATPMSTLLQHDFIMSTSEATKTVTVEDILSHRTGLPSHDFSVLGVHAHHPDNARSVTRKLRHLALNKPVKSTYQYSNIMYTVATHLIETLTMSSFLSFQQSIFNILGMTSTFLQPSQVCAAGQEQRFSTPYYFKNGSYFATQHQETPEAQGSGSIQTSAADFAKFVRAMINRTGPITDTIYESVTTPRVMINAKGNLDQFGPSSSDAAYALGWDIKYYRGIQIVTHGGVISGYGSRMFFSPQLGFGSFIVGNSDGAYDVSSIIQNEVIDEYLQSARDHDFATSIKRLNRFEARRSRREQNVKRNAARRAEAKGTLTKPLNAYLGSYHNEGYHDIVVQEMGGSLFVDGNDRSMPFTMSLEHISGNAEFRGYVTDIDNTEDVVRISFRLEGDQEVSAIGIAFEPALGGKNLIWFDKA